MERLDRRHRSERLFFCVFCALFGRSTKTKHKRSDSWRGWTGDIGLNLCCRFFGCTFWQTSQNKKQNQKFRPMERLGRRHRSELSVFFCFWALVGLNLSFFSWCVYFFRSYFAFANVYIALSSQRPAFLQSTPLHPPWLPLLYIYIYSLQPPKSKIRAFLQKAEMFALCK